MAMAYLAYGKHIVRHGSYENRESYQYSVKYFPEKQVGVFRRTDLEVFAESQAVCKIAGAFVRRPIPPANYLLSVE